MTLAMLIERLEKATGPDREIDLAIAFALGLVPTGPGWKQTAEATWHKNFRWGRTTAEFDDSYQPPAYTASVDAALALVEKMLPGWEWGVRANDGDPGSLAYVHKHGPFGKSKHFSARCATPALALCLALCRAMLAMENAHE